MRFHPHFRHIKGALTIGIILISKETVYGKSSANSPVWPSSEAKPMNGSSSSAKKSGLDQCKDTTITTTATTTKSPECSIISDIPRGGSASSSVGVGVVADTAAAAAALLETTGPYGISLNGWKVILQLILTAMNVVCWFVPLQYTKLTDNRLGLSLANAFSGGVFLSLAFGHLIPECAHGFEELSATSSSEQNKVLPYMFVLAGYLLIFFVEKVAFTHDLEDMHDATTQTTATEGRQQQDSSNINTGVSNSSNNKNILKSGVSSNVEPTPVVVSGRSAVILLLALGIHSVLEMMALGLANTFADSFLLFLSIALHQPAESIALLIAFLKSGLPKRQIIQFLSVFSSLGLVGVLLGIYVKQYASPFLDACMLAVVAGTFVYVGATEIIPEEFEDGEHKWLKFGSLISGIVTIFGITQYTMSWTQE